MAIEMLQAPEFLPAGARVILGLSGGVDSALAAWKLKQAGCAVSALFMKNWEDDDDAEYCAARQDLIDCVSICDVLDIELDVVNFSAEYKDRVFSDFLREYEAGRTPNPDILCNSEIKFRAFLDHALQLGADFIATGHYARVRRVRENGAERSELLRAVDASKDQSYFLYRLNQSQLARALFPLGAMLKRDVRRLASEIGLPVAAKKDSTGICFIGERPFREFLARYLPAKPGEIRALEDNRLLGEHQGLMYHTIGQRKGLHIGGRRDGRGASCGAHEAWYVAAKSVADNILYVVQGHDHPALLQHTLHLADPNWIAGNAPDPAAHYTAKPRYRSPDTACTFTPAEPAALHFTQPVWAAAPGQSAVLYQGEVCLGGGIIARAN